MTPPRPYLNGLMPAPAIRLLGILSFFRVMSAPVGDQRVMQIIDRGYADYDGQKNGRNIIRVTEKGRKAYQSLKRWVA